MFAKHLPPSAGRPRVLALDAASADGLPPDVAVVRDLAAPGLFDAIVGWSGAADLADCLQRLRPGGRLILAAPAAPETAPEEAGAALLAALAEAGYIHCLVEPQAAGSLYRGERPPPGTPLERVRAAANTETAGAAGPYLFLLVQQSPNKPAWRLEPGETLTWRAATLVDPGTGQPVLAAFTSLVKAVAFLQPAVLAGFLSGVNKVGQFPSTAAWDLPVLVNPRFEDWRTARLGPWHSVDPRAAVTGGE
mgnify:CR=1 FL=1